MVDGNAKENDSVIENCGESVVLLDEIVKEGDNGTSECESQDASSHSTTTLNNGEEVKETSALLENGEDSQPHGRGIHPLSALSSLSVAYATTNCDSPSSPEAHIPEVHVSIANSTELNTDGEKTNSNRSKRQRTTDCVPLGAIFHSPDSQQAPNRWGEEIGYKNWLLHLGRRRRCEILILVGFLLWLGFFLVLAIVLNGNANKSSSNQNGANEIQSRRPEVGNSTNEMPSTNKNGFAATESNLPASTRPNTMKSEKIQTTGTSLTTGTTKNLLMSGNGTVSSSGARKSSLNQNGANEIQSHRPEVGNSTNEMPSTNKNGFAATESNLPASIRPTNMKSEEIQTTGTSLITGTTKNLLMSGNGTVSSSGALGMNIDSKSTSDKIKSNYVIGVGRADITGPAADVNMMGYASPSQSTGGIHLRQYSRAFIIEDPESKTRTAFVNIDACMSSTLLKLEVLKILKKKYGDVYNAENLCISGTHTHSAPAGFLQDVLFQISSWGYVPETLNAMVNGIVESIRLADQNMQPGYILINKGELVGSNINRSPMAYENNPHDERMRYRHNVDTEMTLLKFMNKNNQPFAMINWFPVHCTSMNNTNHLISSDNKGYAELLFERYMDPNTLSGTGEFIAAFAQSNEGDVSPNTKGPHCITTGEPCDNIESTCDGKVQDCVASGPGKDMFESTKIIGQNQFDKAKEIFESATIRLQGPVKFIHQYIDMTNYEVVLNKTTTVKTCKPAMGYSFAAGTTDGPGQFDFKQGDKSGNKFWNLIRNFLHPPTTEQAECHAPKPILLDTGEMTRPYDWQPQIVDTQILQLGQFLIIAVPGEFSTMAGRRLRERVLDAFKNLNPNVSHEAAIAGLANSYSDYIATYEEYQIQRYEGASTIYGPHTATAYNQQYDKLAKSLLEDKNIKSMVEPPNNKDKLYNFQVGVIFDRAPMFKSFGDVQTDVETTYALGDVVSVTFVAANPRSCLVSHANMTFLNVEILNSNGTWDVVHTDADWETKFFWFRTSTLTATSDVTITWEIPKSTNPGKYRIQHFGCYQSFWGGIDLYSGTSSEFEVKSD